MKAQLPDFHQTHFDSIQALRGVTALFIVLEHIRFLNCGAFGVDISVVWFCHVWSSPFRQKPKEGFHYAKQ